MNYITQEQAHDMGAKGAPPSEDERLLFEAWMRGHCWAVIGDWNGTTYVHPTEAKGYVNPSAINTRQLWAVWRDRAALAQPAKAVELTNDEMWKVWDDYCGAIPSYDRPAFEPCLYANMLEAAAKERT